MLRANPSIGLQTGTQSAIYSFAVTWEIDVTVMRSSHFVLSLSLSPVVPTYAESLQL
jgi:hypothetical protein